MGDVRTTENQLRYSLLGLALLVALVCSAAAQEEESTQHIPSNLDVIQKLGLQIGDSLAESLRGIDSVQVFVRPIESAWYFEGTMLKALSAHGKVPNQSPSSGGELDVGLLVAKVEYSDVGRHGIFAERMFGRTVSVECSGKVVDRRSGAILLNRNLAGSASDTIDASVIEKLENPGIPATHGVVPGEGFFSTIFEPIVMMGAVGVAVFLLFRVRS